MPAGRRRYYNSSGAKVIAQYYSQILNPRSECRTGGDSIAELQRLRWLCLQLAGDGPC